jgi:amino acid adenylation domain-containing protein
MHSQMSGFRLSPQQRRLSELNAAWTGCHAQCVLVLAGMLETERLKAAWRRIVERHEALRTSLQHVPGLSRPIQVVAETATLAWREINLAALDAEEQERAARQVFDEERRACQTSDTPARAALLNLSHERHMLALSLNAFNADAQTLKNLFREIAAEYGAQAAQLEEEPLQYTQFSEWQNNLLEDEGAARGVEFWRERANAERRELTLPCEHEADKARAFAHEYITSELDAELSGRIGNVARAQGSNAHDLLLACWQTLLWRLTGESGFVVNVVFDGRKFEELEGVVGLLSGALPVACRFDGDERFADVLLHTGKAVRDASSWQEYFYRAETASEEGDGAGVRGASLPVAFELVEWPDAVHAGGVRFSVSRLSACSDAFKLKLSCSRRSGSLVAEFHYDAARFERAVVERLSGQFATLLAGATARVEDAIGELDILGESERRLLLDVWNETRAPYPREMPVQRLFEGQVEATPDAVAVEFEGAQLSFRELNWRANKLAHHLRGLGVGVESLVGVLMERSLGMVVAVWGVLKAGAAYVPLDPSYPQERTKFMMDDARVGTIVTHQHLFERAPAHDARVIRLDTDWPLIDRESDENPANVAAGGDTLAYVIYTSGSTGQPKGAMITHRGLVNYLSWCTRAYPLNEGRGAPVHSPLGFDLTVTSLFSPLLAGRCVTLLTEGPGVESLSEVFKRTGDFSLIKITPAHLELLGQSLAAEELRGGTRALVIGGEALLWENVSAWLKQAPATKLINEYGPTETVVGCCVFEAQGDGEASGGIPIGRPIMNTQLYVLDEGWRPVPIGVTGELYIGGDALARGYLNRPSLTAERFIPNPFGKDAGARLYRTGDLVRYLSNGNLEYLGRTDTQVKVRGFRIELGEIEAALVANPSVKDAAVIAREDEGQRKQLVAYVTARAEAALSSEALRGYLNDRLPEYMVPSAFVLLEALPLTSNGKVDRQALPAPGRAALKAKGVDYIPPRNAIELRLVQMWEEILGVGPIGVRDDFFHLGGHSMMAALMMAQIKQTFGVGLSLSSLFSKATVEHLSSLVQRQGATTLPHSTLVNLRQGDLNRPPLFFVHPGGGNVLCYAEIARRLEDGQACYGFQAQGLEAGREPHTSVEEMAAHYLEAMRRVQPEGPYLIGGWSMGGVVAFEMACQLEQLGERTALLFLIDSRAPTPQLSHLAPDRLTTMVSFAQDLGLDIENLARSVGDLLEMEPDEQLNHVLEYARTSGILPPDADLPHLRGLFHIFETNVRAMVKYVPQERPEHLLLFTAESETGDSTARGWAAFVRGEVEQHVIPGSHYTMMRAPHVEILTERLRSSLSATPATVDEVNEATNVAAGKHAWRVMQTGD